MTATNPCIQCIGEEGSGEDCCIDVFIILNSQELNLFNEFSGFQPAVDQEGAIFYTKKGCPYLDEDFQCGIHDIKPLYCKFYPIFITGVPYIDDKCPASKNLDYSLTIETQLEINTLQEKFPIYKKEWLWEEVEQIIQKND